jgi:hypothetical protein
LPAALLCVAAAFSVCLFVRVALAAPKDAAAQKLREQALYTDFLATNFSAAEAKLSQALALCGDGADCDPKVRARLQCDLGSVFFSDQKKDDAKAHFLLALKDDPNVTIEKDISSPEMQRFFAAAKSAGDNQSGAAPAATAPGAAAASAEDMTHTPPKAQAIMTPLPLYVELPDGVDAAKVIARYKAPGMTSWKTTALKKMGAGWGGYIPCGDIGDSTGDLKYFVQATDSNGDLVASSGRLVSPHVVHIVGELQGEPPHLPDKDPAPRCTQKTDCPPGFPGCHNDSEKVACVSEEDCQTGQECTGGFCTGEAEPPPEVEAPFKQNWLSIAFQADLLLVPSKTDACAGGTGYTCFNGSQYDNSMPLHGADDTVNGGPAIGTMRALLGYDRVLGENIMIGARLGYAFNGGPQRSGAAAFLPVHAEARGAYWFGHDPLGKSGMRFFVLGGVGAAEVDASVPVDTYSTITAYKSMQSNNYSAWRKTGQGFGEVGLGAMFALTPNTGILAELKGMELFPTAGTAAGLQLGYTLGL